VHSAIDLARVRATKVLRLLRNPRSWRIAYRGLRSGVFPSLEHASVPFGFDFATVVDAGASRGQFALFALWRFQHARIICFEPLPEAVGVARQVLPADRVDLHGLALGASSVHTSLHVSAQDDSSSLLPIGREQVDVFPGTQEVRQVTVRVDRLERYLSRDIARPCLLKIDVQGFELDVLKGAGSSLDVVDEILVETSFVELYDGQPLAHEVVSYLASRGLWLANVSGISRRADGQAVQAEFLFRRPPHSESRSAEHLRATNALVS